MLLQSGMRCRPSYFAQQSARLCSSEGVSDSVEMVRVDESLVDVVREVHIYHKQCAPMHDTWFSGEHIHGNICRTDLQAKYKVVATTQELQPASQNNVCHKRVQVPERHREAPQEANPSAKKG